MGDTYLISKWALIRRNELVVVPDKFEIHPVQEDIPHDLKLVELGNKR